MVEQHVLTEADTQIMSKIIADYKASGKVTRAPRTKRKKTTKKKVRK